MDSVLGDCWRCQQPAKGIKCDKCLVAEYCREECRHKHRFIHEVFCQSAQLCVTCSFCGRRSSELKKCSACHRSSYCDTTCQRNHWAVHKTICKHARLTYKLYSNTHVKQTYNHLPWYIGTSLAEDYLNLLKNEGISWTSTLKLLFVGVGDIKDVIKTVTDLPKEFSGKLEFVLNDFSPHIMARNILFLYCALMGEEFNHLVQIWYSVSLTSSCLDYLKSVLTTLINDKREILKSLKGFIDISNSNWESCKNIWKGWLQMANNPEACQAIIDLRKKTLHLQLEINLRWQLGINLSPDVHKESLQVFLANGLFLPLNSPERQKAIHGNPTLTCFNPMKAEYKEKYPDINIEFLNWDKKIPLEGDMIYCVSPLLSVFSCWDYLEVKKNVEFNNDVTEMYVSYLEILFVKFASRVKDRNIHFRLIVDDFQKLNEYLSPEEKYDRIGTNNLCDYYPTLSLLEQFGPRLNGSNEHSVLICREECWTTSTDWHDINAMLPFKKTTALHDFKERAEILEGIPNTKRLACVGEFQLDYKDVLFLFMKLLIETSFQYPLKQIDKLDMKFRNFMSELNHVIPFQREIKLRCVNFTSASFYCRYIEWYPIRKK